MQQKRISRFILSLIACASLLAAVTTNASTALPPPLPRVPLKKLTSVVISLHQLKPISSREVQQV